MVIISLALVENIPFTVAAKELEVDCVVLGLPTEGGVFREEAIRAFAREVEEETGAEVFLV